MVIGSTQRVLCPHTKGSVFSAVLSALPLLTLVGVRCSGASPCSPPLCCTPAAASRPSTTLYPPVRVSRGLPRTACPLTPLLGPSTTNQISTNQVETISQTLVHALATMDDSVDDVFLTGSLRIRSPFLDGVCCLVVSVFQPVTPPRAAPRTPAPRTPLQAPDTSGLAPSTASPPRSPGRGYARGAASRLAASPSLLWRGRRRPRPSPRPLSDPPPPSWAGTPWPSPRPTRPSPPRPTPRPPSYGTSCGQRVPSRRGLRS